MNLEKEMDLALEFLATYVTEGASDEAAMEGIKNLREMFPTAFDRLLLLAEIVTHYEHYPETFPQADLPAIFRSFKPTADFRADIQKLLLKWADSHCYKEFVEAEESGDIFKAVAKKLFDTHGKNITTQHMNEALASV